jgi:hypothetical protein
MPHIGRTFPYHPIYWVPECLFWPAYAPWKMMWHDPLEAIDPWFNVSGPAFVLSDVGEVSDDRQTMTYRWAIDSDTGRWLLKCELTSRVIDGVKVCYMLLTLNDGTEDVGTADANYGAEVRLFPLVGAQGCDPLPGVPAYGPVNCYLRPATYAEGGTPYPHPTGGG